MKVFLTGATGYIGSAVVDALQTAGHSVTGLARSDEAAETLRERGCEVQRGNLEDAEALAAGARAADATIHTASTGDARSGQLDPPAVRAMVDTLKGSERPFIYTSGVWVLGDTGGEPATENAPLDPVPIVSWRPAVEQMVLDAADRGVRTVVIRPAMVYGRGAGIPAMLVNAARKHGAVRYVGTGENRWTMVDVEDLADLYVRAMENAPAGTLLHAAAGPPVRVAEIASAAAVAGGAEGRTASWPLDEAREQLGPFADALALDQWVSGKRAEEMLGWRPQTPSVLEDLRRGSYAG